MYTNVYTHIHAYPSNNTPNTTANITSRLAEETSQHLFSFPHHLVATSPSLSTEKTQMACEAWICFW